VRACCAREITGQRERDVSACNSLSLSQTSEQGAHTLFTGQREREREKEREKERERV
jgi:hypothetical protein